MRAGRVEVTATRWPLSLLLAPARIISPFAKGLEGSLGRTKIDNLLISGFLLGRKLVSTFYEAFLTSTLRLFKRETRKLLLPPEPVFLSSPLSPKAWKLLKKMSTVALIFSGRLITLGIRA